jgi:aspartyl-tRNA(Asn)/glutamyl-tRNA(Gln) amidotransferase subunit C
MALISREEIIKIAHLSRIEIKESEIEGLTRHIQAVLAYAGRVQEVAAQVEEPLDKNINVLREDVIVKTDKDLVLAQAPMREADYFVVPAVLDNE